MSLCSSIDMVVYILTPSRLLASPTWNLLTEMDLPVETPEIVEEEPEEEEKWKLRSGSVLM